MTHHFCSYFDHNYLSRALAMHASLIRHCDDFHLHVLTLSDDCEEVLRYLNIPHVSVTKLSLVEDMFPELLSAKKNRSPIEYIFTLSPAWPMYVLKVCEHVEKVTYLDADLWFFSDPSIIFDEISDRAIAVVPHRFPPEKKSREKFGKYNVGWITFRNNKIGLTCLELWMENCIEWCYDIVEGERFADQGYLNDWPCRFNEVAIIDNPGVNLAPWNIETHALERCMDGSEGVCVDGTPLVFFHFQGTRQVLPRIYDVGLFAHGVSQSKIVRCDIYSAYISELHTIDAWLRRSFPDVFATKQIARTAGKSAIRALKSLVHRDFVFARVGELPCTWQI